MRIDRDVSPAIAAVFGCTVLTGMGTLIDSAKRMPGETGATKLSAEKLIRSMHEPAELDAMRRGEAIRRIIHF